MTVYPLPSYVTQTAPVLRARTQSEALVLVAYRAWAAHFETCRPCNASGWQEPLAPACADGRRLFRRWDRAAVASACLSHG